MNYASLLFLGAALLGILHIILALLVLTHIDQQKKGLLTNRWPLFFIWWPFYSDMYKESAFKLCVFGRVLFLVIISAYVLWFMIKPAE